MPYLGLLPFLLLMKIIDLVANVSVNALSRASPISTWEKQKKKQIFMTVSMPYLGLLPFLLYFWGCGITEKYWHKPLSRASPISTLPHSQRFRTVVSSVSMPYLGLLPFLLKDNSMTMNPSSIVSMPYLGLLPFLREKETDFYDDFEKCQCPISGFSHFYGILLKTL